MFEQWAFAMAGPLVWKSLLDVLHDPVICGDSLRCLFSGASVAQWLGRRTSDPAVMGSIPGPRVLGLRRGVLAYVGLQVKL